jgi:hypothetical protein
MLNQFMVPIKSKYVFLDCLAVYLICKMTNLLWMLKRLNNQLKPHLQIQSLKILTYITINQQAAINKINQVYHLSRLLSVMINRTRGKNVMGILQTINKRIMVYL